MPRTAAASLAEPDAFLAQGRAAVTSIEALYAEALANMRARLSEGGKLSAALIEREQHAAHGLAWLAT